ncbi:MAG: galactokinase [Verrucomicrobiota bacterium]
MNKQLSSVFESTFGVQAQQLAFAPGRIEFIGNHTDYNGGLVMGAAVTEGITVAVAKREDREIHLVSSQGGEVKLLLDNLTPIAGQGSWANYPAGVTKVLLEEGMKMDTGYSIAVASNLPAGAGMSSSAAFELATAKALAALYGFRTDKAGFARIGRKAENEFVGMPCGILDQGVSAFGQANHLVRIDCATEDFSIKPMPAGAHFWIFNSNKKHALVDSAYAERHKECHDALEQLQKHYPEAKTLSDISLEQLEDAAATVDELLFKRASHVVGENARVREVEAALDAEDLDVVGVALKVSHRSSMFNFENSIQELDTIFESVTSQPHVFGARLTGGGFGGAVMALTSDSFGEEQVASVKKAYQGKHGLEATVFHTRAGDGARLV